VSGPLHRADIEAGLREVADQLQRDGGAQVSIIVVGGSFMALHGLRDSTADVDSVSQLDDRLLAAVRRVAVQRGWPEQWLNDRARPWRTAGLQIPNCLLVLDHPALAVYTPGYDVMFLMKLNAARGPQDYADARALWPHTDFADAEAVVRAFYDAYPNERPDPDLTDFVRTFQAPRPP
jgi:hypothetical protein